MNYKFVYSSYWHTWSRVLQTFKVGAIEINLTENMPSEWKRVKRENIRKHSTARDRSDKFANELPADVIAEMKQQLGDELTERLLTFDYLPNIDWDKYNKQCNGGAAFDLIKKEEPNNAH